MGAFPGKRAGWVADRTATGCAATCGRRRNPVAPATIVAATSRATTPMTSGAWNLLLVRCTA